MANAGKVIGKGVTIELEGNVYRVDDFQHVKPGKGAAFIRTRLKNNRRSCRENFPSDRGCRDSTR